MNPRRILSRGLRLSKLALAIGLRNVARVTVYRLAIRFRVHPVQRLSGAEPSGPYFSQFEPARHRWPEGQAVGSWRLFGWQQARLHGAPPNWFENIATGTCAPGVHLPWWDIADFSAELGDIKTVWERSRFDWLVLMAANAKEQGDSAVQQMNTWLADWVKNNPPYYGHNWKCGQEASIRVIHAITAVYLLGQEGAAESGLIEFVSMHLRRIAPTTDYAVAQDNNHGTTEALALFLGGHWLAANGADPQAMKWAKKGRKLLEERVARLVSVDGSFSQYSVNYHRLLLSSLCMAEFWRREQQLPKFSLRWYARAASATTWLYRLVEPASGDAPNLGANDGARLLPISAADFRDYRPEVQWAAALFLQRKAYLHMPPFPLLGSSFERTAKLAPIDEESMSLMSDGGYAVLQNDDLRCVFKFPRYRFRPRHADALHLDVWHGSTNLARDGGSFSYNSSPEWEAYFPGTKAHNTVQFDARDQMPKLGRFLRDHWLSTLGLQGPRRLGDSQCVQATYRDWKGAEHRRQVSMSGASLLVEDQVSGFEQTAVLRWRLPAWDWQLEESGVSFGGYRLEISSDVSIQRIELTDAWESRYYLKKDKILALEIEVNQAATLTTRIQCPSNHNNA